MTDSQIEYVNVAQYILVKKTDQQLEQARNNSQKMVETGLKLIGIGLFCIVIGKISLSILGSLSNR